jgi:hypothetical protein
MGNPASKVADVRVPGPLARYAAGFRSALLAAGYTPLSAVNLMRLMVHLSRWLEARRLPVAGLTEQRVEEYLLARRTAGYMQHYTRRGLAPLLEFLAAHGVRPAQQARPASSTIQVLLGSFERYLLAERGLSASTASAYVARAGRFLGGYTVDGQVGAVTAADITRAVTAEAGRVSVGVGAVLRGGRPRVPAVLPYRRAGHRRPVGGGVDGDRPPVAAAAQGNQLRRGGHVAALL